MPVLGQLVYTSFHRVGFRVLASAQVPTEIQQTFIQKVVYQRWDSYDPPISGYRAVYLYQVTPKQSLFGWLYNDGLDEFGRSHVPYFICYYLAELLQAVQLENIFTCLHRGPLALIDRQSLPAVLDTIVTSDFSSYQPARIGVKIPSDVRERSYFAFKQKRLLDLFVAVDEQEIDTSVFQARPSGQGIVPFFWGDQPQKLLGAQTSDTSFPTPIKSAVLISLGGASALVMIGSYYFLRPPAPSVQVQQDPVFFPLKNTSLEDIFLARTLAGHSNSVWAIALSPNGQTLISGSSDKTIKVWDLNTGQLSRTLSGHSDIVRSLTLSSDGQTLASGSGDKTIKLWNLQTGKLLQTLSGHSGPVWSVASSLNPTANSFNRHTLVSGSEDGTIKVWELQTGELLHTLSGHSGRVFSVAINPNGQNLASSGIDKTIKIWNLQTGELLRTLKSHSDAVRTLSISPDGQKFASGSWDKTIKVWHLQTGELLHTFKGHTGRVVSVIFISNGQIASASTDKTIKIWSLLTGKLLRNLSGHSDWVLSIAISPTGQTLVSSSKDKTIKIWQTHELLVDEVGTRGIQHR